MTKYSSVSIVTERKVNYRCSDFLFDMSISACHIVQIPKSRAFALWTTIDSAARMIRELAPRVFLIQLRPEKQTEDEGSKEG